MYTVIVFHVHPESVPRLGCFSTYITIKLGKVHMFGLDMTGHVKFVKALLPTQIAIPTFGKLVPG